MGVRVKGMELLVLGEQRWVRVLVPREGRLLAKGRREVVLGLGEGRRANLVEIIGRASGVLVWIDITTMEMKPCSPMVSLATQDSLKGPGRLERLSFALYVTAVAN